MTDEKKSEGGSAIVRSAEQARALALNLAGKAPNRMTYWCTACGFQDQKGVIDPDTGLTKVHYARGLSLEFDPDEMAMYDNDLTKYTGPCPVCEYMTLVPYGSMFADHGTILGDAREQKRREYSDQAEVFIDKVKQEVGGIFGGSRSMADDQAVTDAVQEVLVEKDK